MQGYGAVSPPPKHPYGCQGGGTGGTGGVCRVMGGLGCEGGGLQCYGDVTPHESPRMATRGVGWGLGGGLQGCGAVSTPPKHPYGR